MRFAHTYTHTHTHTHTHTYTHTHTHIYTHTYILSHTHPYGARPVHLIMVVCVMPEEELRQMDATQVTGVPRS